MAKFHRIDHVALHVKDVEASKRFYEDHFGFRTYFSDSPRPGFNIAYLKLGDTVLEITGTGAQPSSGFHFCLETDDFDGAVASLKKAGVPVAQEPHKTSARESREANWRRVVFKGPDGELVEIRG